jgi:hypothetical protein
MKVYGAILTTAIAAATIAFPARADGLPNGGAAINSAVVHSMDGKTTIVPISAARQAELLASPHAKQLGAGICVLVVDGKTYVIDDHTMPSGKQMIAAVLEDFTPPQGGG